MSDSCKHKFIDSNHCLKCGWTPPGALAAPTGSATRFTFMSDDGKYPLSHDGKVQWLSNREETIRQAKSWGFNILVEMDDQGHLLGMVNLKSPNTPHE